MLLIFVFYLHSIFSNRFLFSFTMFYTQFTQLIFSIRNYLIICNSFLFVFEVGTYIKGPRERRGTCLTALEISQSENMFPSINYKMYVLIGIPINWYPLFNSESDFFLPTLLSKQCSQRYRFNR